MWRVVAGLCEDGLCGCAGEVCLCEDVGGVCWEEGGRFVEMVDQEGYIGERVVERLDEAAEQAVDVSVVGAERVCAFCVVVDYAGPEVCLLGLSDVYVLEDFFAGDTEEGRYRGEDCVEVVY